MPVSYPLILDISSRPVVIVGGGKVAVRKAKGLLAAGAMCVTIVSPDVDQEMPKGIRLIPETFRPEHVEGASLVFAATDVPKVNEEVALECRRRSIPVNRADAEDEASSDFSTPALWREGEVMVTVSTGGNAALAARIRDEIAAGLDRRWIALAGVLQKVRPLVRARKDLTQCRRAEILREISGDLGRDIVERDGEDGLARWIEKRLAAIESQSSATPRC
ncbi:MAG: bifunctional precorrin-2 dehydrogenase/sirohydrochlorin ferrochelatase [Tepidisphaeraceae bacterium]